MMKRRQTRWLKVLQVLFCSIILAEVQALDRDVIVDSDPQGATVSVDGKPLSMLTPTLAFELDWKSSTIYTIEVALPGYQVERIALNYQQAKAVKVKPWRLPVFQLQPLLVRQPVSIRSTVTGAEILINDQLVGETVVATNLVFRRASVEAAWSTNVVSARKLPGFAVDEATITFSEVLAAAKEGGLSVELQPGEVERVLKVEIQSNETGAEVRVDGQPVGRTPLQYDFVFRRADAAEAWPVREVSIAKDGYEYLPSGEDTPRPAFTTTVTADLSERLIEATSFVVPRYVRSPVRLFDVRREGVGLVSSNLWSQVSGGERDEKATSMTLLREGRPLVVSGLAALPDVSDQFVYVEPVWEDRGGASDSVVLPRLQGSHLMKQQGSGATTPMTDSGRFFDLDPCVTANWIYFSSDRNGDRIIWRVPLSGKGGYTPITGTHTKFDIEPAVNRDETRLAFVSRMPNAPASMPPDIWIADAEGKLPTRYYPGGRSPAWSPDGKRLAYVNAASNLCVVVLDNGQNPTQLTSGPDHRVSRPVWLDDHRIVYCDHQNKNGRGEHHFDLWMWDLDRNSTQALTSDGSYDASPTVGRDGRQVFFYSNRGATRTGQEQLKVYSLLLEMGANGR